MMKKFILLTIILAFTASEVAAATVWRVAPGRSKIGFSVKHLVFMDVKGRFKEFEGRVVSHGSEGLENSEMLMTIDAKSIYTGIDDRDKHLISKDFFFTDKFPSITFKSHSVIKMKDDKGCYKIHGELTMRGITKPIILEAKCKSMKKLSNGKTRMDLVATGKVNRFDYKLQWNELLETGKAIVGEDVNLTLKIALLDS